MEQFNSYFMDVIKNKYFQFQGRAPRREFWYFTLFIFIISFVLGLVDQVAGTMITLGMDPQTGLPIQLGLLSIIFSLATFIPTMSISFRRLHDIGKSAWWLLIALIPLIGVFILLYFYITPSQDSDNPFGPYPTN